MTSGKPMAYPKRTTQLHSGMTCLFCPAPNKLLTSEPVVAASELTMTKNTVETLRMTLVAASSISPKCSTATKKASHEATPINEWNMLQTDTRQTCSNTALSKLQDKP